MAKGLLRGTPRDLAEVEVEAEVEIWTERSDATGENTGRFWLSIVETHDHSLRKFYADGIVMSRDELSELRSRIDRALANA